MDRRGFIRGMLGTIALAAVPFKWAFGKTAKVYTGARAKLYINGHLIGYATDVSYTRDAMLPIEVLGKYNVAEIFPSEPIETMFTCSRVVEGPEWDKFMQSMLEDKDGRKSDS